MLARSFKSGCGKEKIFLQSTVHEGGVVGKNAIENGEASFLSFSMARLSFLSIFNGDLSYTLLFYYEDTVSIQENEAYGQGNETYDNTQWNMVNALMF